MSFNRLKKALGIGAEQKALSLTDPDALTLFGAVPTSSGVSVGPGNALRVPAVACAVSLIAESTGSLPVKLYDRASKAALTDSPVYRLVHDESNEWTSAAELRRDLTCDALLHGAGHAQVIRLNDGTPYELHRLEPGRMQRDLERDGEPFYRVSSESDSSIAEIAFLTGFSEQSTFSRAFKRWVGLAPAQFRQQFPDL